MGKLTSLAKDTAIYGLSSILGRFLNWCLVPLYVYIFPAAEYGIVSYLYSFTAVALIILTYGMETGFFRYSSRSPHPESVYTTSLISIGVTSLLFILLLSWLLQPVSDLLLLPRHPGYVWMLGVTVAIDAFTCIPFAYLRFSNKAWTFAGLKFLNIGLNIALNLFFLLLCPKIHASSPGAIGWFYEPLGGESFGIGWIFLANLISSAVICLTLLPWIPTPGRYRRRCAAAYGADVRIRAFDTPLWRKMLSYSWPLLILGVAGIMSQNMGQMIIPYLFSHSEEAARTMVGIYGANIKIAIVMVMFTQAFRYAYEPFIFSQAKRAGEDNRQAYADATKYFVIFGLLIFLAVMYYLPIIRYFESPGYWEGLRVVPVMMVAELFAGVYFNLSVWYKLTDRTRWGMYFSLICFALMGGLNVWLVTSIGIPDGYMGSAWAALISYFAVMVLSWAVGRKYYPVPYPIVRMGCYGLLAAVLCLAGTMTDPEATPWLAYAVRTVLLLIYIIILALFENIPVLTPMVRRLLPGGVRKKITK